MAFEALYPWHEIIYKYMVHEEGETRDFITFWKESTEVNFSTGMGKFWLENNLFITQRDIKPEYLDTLHQLSDIYDLYYITARPETAWYDTKYWFRRNKIPQLENLYCVTSEKLPVVVTNEIDIYVEDRIKHILELKNYTNVILIRQPWNEEIWDEFPTLDSVTQLPELLGV